MVRLLLATCLGLGACAGPGGPGRPEQVWTVDLHSFADELRPILASRGLDLDDVAARALEKLHGFYTGFPVRFRLGTAAVEGQSYICVRTTDGTALGRAILDLGNNGTEFNCGGGFGIFLDNIIGQIEGQLADVNPERVSLLLAVVLAHEIGHSLGLEHTVGALSPGDIMIGNGILDVRVTDFFFRPEHLALLETNLSHEPDG